MEVSASAQDYLETILLLSRKTGMVRSKDVAEETGFSKPSVSVAMKKLREGGLISMNPDGFITLTDAGKAAAQEVYDRHSTLFDWLVGIGVSERNAAADACRMEHVISAESFEGIKNHCRRCRKSAADYSI